MLHKGWGPELRVGGNKNKNQWTRIDKGANKDHKELMLNTDLCFAYRNNKDMASCVDSNGGKNDPNSDSACAE